MLVVDDGRSNDDGEFEFEWELERDESADGGDTNDDDDVGCVHSIDLPVVPGMSPISSGGIIGGDDVWWPGVHIVD